MKKVLVLTVLKRKMHTIIFRAMWGSTLVSQKAEEVKEKS